MFICENLEANVETSAKLIKTFAVLSDFVLYSQHFEQDFVCDVTSQSGKRECLAVCKKLRSTLPWGKLPFYTNPMSPFVLVHITSSIRSSGPTNYTIFEEPSRQRQLIFTIRSVVRKIQNPVIILTETHELSDEFRQILHSEGVRDIRVYPDNQNLQKSISECRFIDSVLTEYITENSFFHAYCKLSARYYLLENFEYFHEVMCKITTHNVIQTRFFNIPRRLFPRLKEVFRTIRDDPRLGTSHDIEHLISCHFPELMDAPMLRSNLGVGGFLAGLCQPVID